MSSESGWKNWSRASLARSLSWGEDEGVIPHREGPMTSAQLEVSVRTARPREDLSEAGEVGCRVESAKRRAEAVSACRRHRRESLDPVYCQNGVHCVRRAQTNRKRASKLHWPLRREFRTMDRKTLTRAPGSSSPGHWTRGTGINHAVRISESADGLYICIFSSRACAAFALGFPITAFLMARSAAFVCTVDASIVVETKKEGAKHGMWGVPALEKKSG